jgi:hypothetical protein
MHITSTSVGLSNQNLRSTTRLAAMVVVAVAGFTAAARAQAYPQNPALLAQQQWFARQQAAHRAQVAQGDARLAAIQQRSAQQFAANERWDHEAIRGEAQYVDPPTGQRQWLPYAAQPGQITSWGGNNYVMDRQGQYWVQNGQYWTRMGTAER